jgi:hypothetical protein
MMRVAGKSLNSAVQLAGILLVLWAVAWFANLSQTTPGFATELQQCTQTLPSCGCNSCGEVDHGRPSCPSGQSLYDDYCLPDCPVGFIRYPGIPGLCIPPVEFGCSEGFDQVPLPSCPQGYVRDLRDPDRCVPDYGALQNGGECPYGMAWANETGRCEVDCPQGTYRDGHGLCQSYYGRNCPEGLSRDGETGRCLPPGIWPPNYGWVCLATCPQGYTRDIQHPTRCLPPPPSCPQGFINVNGRCLPDCDKGITRDNYGYCVPPTCPDGTYSNLRGQCVPPPCLDGTARNSDGNCQPPQTGCPQGSETFRGQCVPMCKDGLNRDDNGRCVPPPPTGCLQGMETFRGQCVSICRQGLIRDNNGRCVNPPSSKPPVILCKYNEVRDSNGRCVPFRQQPDCPRGFKIDANGDCTRIVRPVPQGCPDGMILNRRTQRCVPLQFNPGDNGDNFVPPAINRQPPVMLNPGVLKQLMPQGGNGGANIQGGCPDGTARDKNGRCMPVQ